MLDRDAVTRAEDVELPIKMVTLSSLKTKSGAPVVVQCERVDELRLAKMGKRWPGAVDAPKQDAPSDPDDAMRGMEELNAYAAPLITEGTALLREDGSEVRPAFYWDAKDRVEGSIPGRMLRQADVVLLVETILDLSGSGGAAEAGFHDGDGVGRPDGKRAVEASEGER